MATPKPQASFEREKLTEREKRILRLLCDGLTNAQIASRMGVPRRLVRGGLVRIFRKIDAGEERRDRVDSREIGGKDRTRPAAPRRRRR